MLAEQADLEAFAEQVSREGYTDVVLLGMGGSSLAPEVLRRTFGPRRDRPTLHVLDSTDAATIRAVQGAIDLRHTLFVVSSKSGGTIEPLSLFAHFWSLLEEGRSFVAITDPGRASSSSPASMASGARSTATRTSVVATARCPRSASCPRR